MDLIFAHIGSLQLPPLYKAEIEWYRFAPYDLLYGKLEHNVAYIHVPIQLYICIPEVHSLELDRDVKCILTEIHVEVF
jgi:hypothetical protein